MAKRTGLGDRFYLGGVDLSGDIGELGRIGGGPSPLEVTSISKSAVERIGGKRDGSIEFSSWFNPSTAASHDVLGNLPTGQVIVTYCNGAAIGNAAGACIARQVNYDANRGEDGSLAFAVAAQSDSTGVEFCEQLTAGVRTDTAATNGAGLDLTTVSTSFGWQAYLHVLSVAGTSVTVALQDSADNVSFAALTGGAFTAVTPAGAPTAQRLAGGSTATVRRYVRVVTTGTFSSAAFVVVFARNLTATTF